MQIPKTLERPAAHAGAMLSRAGVRFPNLIGRHIVGQAGSNFTPLPYRVARTRLSDLDVDSYATYAGNPTAGFWPKDFPTAGITVISPRALRRQPGESRLARAVIGWAFGDQLLVAPIPEAELPDADGSIADEDRYAFAMRIGREDLHVTAGVLNENRMLRVSGVVIATNVVPIDQLPPGIPLH
jgi:hypothetical protein